MAKNKTSKTENIEESPKTALILRTCDKDLKSHGGFQWPESGQIECPDWKSTAACGNGLHGLLWGEGNWGLLSNDADAKWLVVKVIESDIVAIDSEKVKFPRGEVIYCGDMIGAMILTLCNKEQITDFVKEACDGSKNASSGYGSKNASSGYGSKNASSGDGSQNASSGDESAHESKGEKSIDMLAGFNGTVIAAAKGAFALAWFDEKADRPRIAIGYVGEDGIKAGVKYCVNEKGKIVEVKK